MTLHTADFFLFEVIVDNGLKGVQFILKGNEIYPNLQFHKQYILARMWGKAPAVISGFKISLIPPSTAHLYHHGMPKAIKALREKNKRYGQSHVVPVIGTVNVGKYAGLVFSFFGSQDIPSFFSQGVISMAVNGRVTQHKGCTFRTATHQEAIPFHGKFTFDVEDDLSQYRFMIKPIVAIPLRGRYRGIEYPLLSANQVKQFFSTAMARAVATGSKTSYKGFTFKDVSYEDVKGNTRKLSQCVIDETTDALKVPCIAEIIKGELAGHRFGFIYKSVLEEYFISRIVQAVIRGDRVAYKGCVFKASTYKEARDLTQNLTPEVIDFLNQKSRY